MIEITYLKDPDTPIASMRGHVPNTGDEIVLGSPYSIASGAKIWRVVKVRRYHWFDLTEGHFIQAAEVYLEAGHE